MPSNKYYRDLNDTDRVSRKWFSDKAYDGGIPTGIQGCTYNLMNGPNEIVVVSGFDVHQTLYSESDTGSLFCTGYIDSGYILRDGKLCLISGFSLNGLTMDPSLIFVISGNGLSGIAYGDPLDLPKTDLFEVAMVMPTVFSNKVYSHYSGGYQVVPNKIESKNLVHRGESIRLFESMPYPSGNIYSGYEDWVLSLGIGDKVFIQNHPGEYLRIRSEEYIQFDAPFTNTDYVHCYSLYSRSNAYITGTLNVSGNINTSGSLYVGKNTIADGNVNISGNVAITGALFISGNSDSQLRNISYLTTPNSDAGLIIQNKTTSENHRTIYITSAAEWSSMFTANAYNGYDGDVLILCGSWSDTTNSRTIGKAISIYGSKSVSVRLYQITCDDVLIDGITLDAGISANSRDNLVINNCATNSGIGLFGCTNSMISNCVAATSLIVGSYSKIIGCSCTRVLIDGNYITVTGCSIVLISNDQLECVRIQNATHCTLSGNTITISSTSVWSTLITFNNSSYITVTGNDLQATLSGNYATTFYLETVSHINIVGNMVKSTMTGTEGWVFLISSSGTYITFTSNSTEISSSSGILYVSGTSSNVYVTHNYPDISV